MALINSGCAPFRYFAEKVPRHPPAPSAPASRPAIQPQPCHLSPAATRNQRDGMQVDMTWSCIISLLAKGGRHDMGCIVSFAGKRWSTTR